MQAPRPSLSRSRDRVAGLRLPELPPRDLERLDAGPHSAPVLSAPNSASYGLPVPVATPTKFGCDGSPADVRGYSPATPLLMRGGVVSPGRGGGSGLVLPNLSLPLSNGNVLPPVSSVPGATPPNLPTSGSLMSRHVTPRTVSRSGIRTTPSSPVTAQHMTPTEIKKAQNRKSAKRFREAQKQRWKNMADDLMIHKRTIDDLRAQLAAQAQSVAQANEALRQHAMKDKRNSIGINDLVEPSAESGSTPLQLDGEAEAALYAQILSNTAQKEGGANKQPYVCELGLLTVCVVVDSKTSRVVTVRRGNANSFGTFGVEGLPPADEAEFRTALTCGKPVAVAYSRRGVRVNAVVNPVEKTDRVVVAEFSPFQ